MTTVFRRKVPAALVLAVVATASGGTGCSAIKPAARDAHHIAKDLCKEFFSEKQGISVEDAGRAFCATERDLRPWLDEILSAKQRAGKVAEGTDPRPGE